MAVKPADAPSILPIFLTMFLDLFGVVIPIFAPYY